VVESYRLSAPAAGSIDFAEAAAIAAAHLDLDAAKGGTRPFNHVLIDEAQDLSPTHWQLSRASWTRDRTTPSSPRTQWEHSPGGGPSGRDGACRELFRGEGSTY
jgi:hypothetical protein